MKKRLFAVCCAAVAALCVTAAGALQLQDSTGMVTPGKDFTDMVLEGNAMGNYVRGNGSAHNPAQSFLYANEDGGVSVVQHRRGGTVTVADFDAELNFLRTRNVALLGRYGTYNGWGAFYAGEKYNYMIFLDSNDLDEDVLRIDCYTKDWSQWDGVRIPTYYIPARGLISNDLDVTESDGSLYIVSNYTLSSSIAEHNGHEANFRVQLNAETLAVEAVHSGVNSYDGYASHSFMPEVAANNGVIYTFDRSDKYPGSGIFMTAFQGGLHSTGLKNRLLRSMTVNDWGSQGNAIPAGDGVLTAYTYAPNSVSNTATNVYLYYADPSGAQSSLAVTQNGGAGTPYVAAVDKNTGFVLWNPDRFSDETLHNLYYAAYTVSDSGVSVGRVNMAEGHYLSDCEPIAFDGGVLWYTVENGELIFHKLHPTKGLSTVLHHNWKSVAGREPTCSEVGLTEGVQCAGCKLWYAEQEEIPTLPHTEKIIPAVAPTCAKTGLSEGKQCTVCSSVYVKQETVEKLPHTEQVIPAVEPTCSESGLTEGKQCTVCSQITVRQEQVSRLGHELEEVPAVPATYYADGYSRGFRCTRCQKWSTEPTVIPRLQTWVRSYSAMAAWNSLNVDLVRPCKDPLDVLCVFYDGEGRMMEIQKGDDLGPYDGAYFKLVDGAASFAVFVLDNDLIPLGPAYRSELVVSP